MTASSVGKHGDLESGREFRWHSLGDFLDLGSNLMAQNTGIGDDGIESAKGIEIRSAVADPPHAK